MAGDTDNEVSGTVAGTVVQAGTIHGGVHFPSDRAPVVPRQLPAAVSHFVGRHDEFAALAQSLDRAATGMEAVVISAINGTAGIGKTALAVHWAHQAADRFPDGQLYVNLRGFDPAGEPVQPDEAVRIFLAAFEVSPERIPVNIDAQAALYRSLLANRKVLVVLDNARDAEQVRSLLPGSPSCLVVVTSRNRLTSLIAQEGAQSVTLDVLDQDEATALLVRLLGRDRVEGQSDAAAELIERCARLPLALAIAAARAAATPRFPLRVLAEELRNEQDRLDVLDAGDPPTNVRVVFSWSYRALTPPAARLFRLLGLHPGPDIGLHAAASLAEVDLSRARALLAEATRLHLLDEHTPGRYRFHDLLRAYAAEQAAAEEPVAHQRAAIHRVLDFYLHAGFAANQHLYPDRVFFTLENPQPGVVPQRIADFPQAVEWFAAEHATLLAATVHAARVGFDIHAWQLPCIIATFLDRQGLWREWAAVHETALAVTERLGDRNGQACTHRLISTACFRLARRTEAAAHLQHALVLCQELGDHAGQARSHHYLSWVCAWQGDYTGAFTHAQRALDLYRTAGHRMGEADANTALGWSHALLGRSEQALSHFQPALDVFRDFGDRMGEAQTLYGVGIAHHSFGRQTQAITYYQQALALFRELDYRYFEADILSHLGYAHHADDDHSAAGAAWRQALAILDQLAHPNADVIRAALAEVDPS